MRDQSQQVTGPDSRVLNVSSVLRIFVRQVVIPRGKQQINASFNEASSGHVTKRKLCINVSNTNQSDQLHKMSVGSKLSVS